MGKKKRAFQYIVPVLVILLAVPLLTQENIEKPQVRENIRCLICLRGHHPANINLSTGFNYELVNDYAKSISSVADIQVCEFESEALTLLSEDSIDVAILPFSALLSTSNQYLCSEMMEDSTVWVVYRGNRDMAESITAWHNMFHGKDEYNKIKERFSPAYEPYRRAYSGREYKTISPYDNLIKEYSEKIGWDWRMLAALIWQESRFRIDARSGKGAEGLLQMLPSTAQRFHNDDMLNPEKNISAGVEYIGKLKGIFTRFAAPQDLTKFVLAAYSAGEGRVLDCIRYAKAHDMPYSTWGDFESIIDTLRSNVAAPADTLLQYGGLRGYETINYVANIYSLYDAFMIISPGPSLQDQPAIRKETESEEEALSQDTQPDQPQQ